VSSLRLFVTVAIAAGALGACSGGTAILLRVTRDATVPATVPRIHVLLGVKASGDVASPSTNDPAGTTIPTYVDDDVATERVDTDGDRAPVERVGDHPVGRARQRVPGRTGDAVPRLGIGVGVVTARGAGPAV
jgi:hypothetical protein